MSEERKVLPGDKVNWLYEARGGYGYVSSVAAVVSRVGSKRVEIRIASRSRDQWVVMTRWVQPERLTPRNAPAGDVERLLEGARVENARMRRKLTRSDQTKDMPIPMTRAGAFLGPCPELER
jgi:hypothetical protein